MKNIFFNGMLVISDFAFIQRQITPVFFKYNAKQKYFSGRNILTAVQCGLVYKRDGKRVG